MTSPEATVEDGGFSGRNVVVTTGVLCLAGGVLFGVVRHSFPAGLSLTGAGAVAIINFRWLEAVLRRVVQPGAPQFDFGSVLRIFGRMALFGIVMAALLWVPRIDAIGVALGFSVFVAALIGEGIRGSRFGGG